MNDFVVRRLDGTTFKSLYFRDGKWIGTSEAASKMRWSDAEYIKNWYNSHEEDALFDLIIRKDSLIAQVTEDLMAL